MSERGQRRREPVLVREYIGHLQLQLHSSVNVKYKLDNYKPYQDRNTTCATQHIDTSKESWLNWPNFPGSV
jgi:hypothetical protein